MSERIMLRHAQVTKGTDKMADQAMPRDETAAVVVHDLTVAYRETPVLWDVDVTIPTGTLTAIIGPNGAGKSTFIKAVLGLIPVAAGTVEIFGHSTPKQRKLVGYVPQRGSVDWSFPTNALDVVTMGTYGQLGWIRRPGKPERARAMHALDQVGMTDFADRQISQLSGGQQQRVFLARALIQDQQLYFMDEPFAGVDAATEKAIVGILQELRSQGKTVVVVHHDLESAPDYFDWLVLLNVRVMDSGPFAETFTAENLSRTYGGNLNLLSSRTPPRMAEREAGSNVAATGGAGEISRQARNDGEVAGRDGEVASHAYGVSRHQGTAVSNGIEQSE